MGVKMWSFENLVTPSRTDQEQRAQVINTRNKNSVTANSKHNKIIISC